MLALVFVLSSLATFHCESVHGPIIFPDNQRDTHAADPETESIPECLTLHGYCEDEIPSHPDRNTLQRLIQEGKFILPTVDQSNATPFVANRIGAFERSVEVLNETSLCYSRRRTIYPRLGIDRNMNSLRVINDDDFMRQGVDVEQCTNKDQPCLIDEEATVCRQKYSYYLFLVYKNGSITSDRLRLPSSCVCRINNDFLDRRFGGACRAGSTSRGCSRAPSHTRRPSSTGARRRRVLLTVEAARGRREAVEPAETAKEAIDSAVDNDNNNNNNAQQQDVGSFSAGEVVVNSNAITVRPRPVQSIDQN